MKKMSRREALASALGAAASANASAQSPTSADDWAKAAREANRTNADALAKVKLPMSTEPAFLFKA